MVIVFLGSPTLPPHLQMFNHVEAASVLCDNASVTSDASSSTDDRDVMSRDIANDLGVTPLVSKAKCIFIYTLYFQLISNPASISCQYF